MLKRTIRYMALGATGLSGSLLACGSPSSGNAAATTNATVSVDVYNGTGLKVGTCLGTVISPDTILTAGHCAAGFAWWQVTSGSGQVAHSSIAYTYDWQNFQSDKSHPVHTDVAILKLDTQIHLAQYPGLASSALASGAAAVRIRPASAGGVEAVGAVAYDGASVGFPHYYYTAIDASEQLETGGALVDPATNTIYGVASGRGYATGNLYISRVEALAEWLGTMSSCNAGSGTPQVASASSSIGVECHSHGPPPSCDAGAPPPPPVCDGGESSSGSGSGGSSSGGSSSGGSSSGGSSSGGSSSGGSSSGGSGSGGTTGSSGSGSSSGGSSSGSSGGNGTTSSSGGGGWGSGDGGSCSGGGGYCQGSGCGATGGGNGTTGSGSGSGSGGSGSGGSGSGGSGSGGSGSGGSGSGGSGSGGSGSGGSGSGGTTGGGNGTTGSSGGGASSSGGGYNGNGGGPTGGGNGTTGSNGGDGPGCTDSTCGGCGSDPTCSDNTEDFGGVPGAGSGSASGRAY